MKIYDSLEQLENKIVQLIKSTNEHKIISITAFEFLTKIIAVFSNSKWY
ncbi:MAG: hypothetical protein GKR88_00350 [Flavobacteriaceae bacterium]|nr:MAG: hypothetical protein GKR88_00350 [Flavobacteriaceae bacterium]